MALSTIVFGYFVYICVLIITVKRHMRTALKVVINLISDNILHFNKGQLIKIRCVIFGDNQFM